MKSLFILSILLFSLNSLADAVNETFAVSCNPATQEMKVVSTFINLAHMEMNKIPKGYVLGTETCSFLNKTKTKIILHEKKASLRGACGANPEIFLELVKPDGRAMKTVFSPKCGGTLIKSITVSKKATEICEYITINYKAPWTAKTLEPEYVCRRL